MKKRIKKLLILILCALINISQVSSEQLNTTIDVDTNVYVQHDSNNNDIYLLNSEGKTTTIYQIINAKYTASKQWTKDGLYIDDKTGKVSATSPNDYISVKENEVYFVRLYGIGDKYTGINNNEYHITTPIVFFDNEGNCIGSALSGTYSASKSGVEITVPKGATKMYISNYNNQNISIQKKLILKEKEFQKIKERQEQILNYVNTNYENIQKDPIIYKELDKAYITFVNDDSRPNVDKFADLFISKKNPLCLASVYDNLLNTSSNLKETRLEVALRVQEAGGEILAHNAQVITEENITNNNFMYNYFVVQKQLLKKSGLNVNGIILAGGTGQITGSPISAKWTSAIYKYSDLLGEKYDNNLGIDSVYYHYRTALSNYNNDIDKIKEEIDKAIEEKTWKVFYFHDTNEISLETLEEILDYINSKNKNEIEIVTYNTMYQKYATKESTIKNTKKTYYVSSSGTSNDGTDIKNPINLETLNKKKIKTGDTILFKSGDTFFGTINFSVANVDNKDIIISNYGKGELPTISTYKYISNDWTKYNENIYRIDIKNNGIGYKSDNESSYNVGFLEDDNGIKYYNKKKSIEALKNKYDFYSDGKQYLYMYISSNPYEELGNLKVVVRSNLMTLSSNMKISNIRFSYSGGHALVGANLNEENITISNVIIENIGGSYLYSSNLSNDTRYGNGIEFYGSNAKNIDIKNNIFRNIYDVAFTIQGPTGSGENIYVHDNVFINNSQDSEIWESSTATGINNYKFYNNLSINQGRGWSYEARPDKYPAASILFWNYTIDNTDISFNNNVFYNPRQIYYFSVETDKYFLSHNTIKSDNNLYYMLEDTTIYRNNWKYQTKEEFKSKYNVDKNSTYKLITPNINITEQANTLNNINKIRMLILDKKDVIKNIELSKETITIKKGNIINLKDLKLQINYKDGLTDEINVSNDMLSNIDYNEIGNQIVTISYLGYKTSLNIEIIEENKIEKDTNTKNNILTTEKEETTIKENKSNNTTILENKEKNVVTDNKTYDSKEKDILNNEKTYDLKTTEENNTNKIKTKQDNTKKINKEKSETIKITYIILSIGIIIIFILFVKKYIKI